MTDRPQRWAVEAADAVWIRYGSMEMTDKGNAVQDIMEAAAPLLAVVEAVISSDGQCSVCTEYVLGEYVEGDGAHGYTENDDPCPVPRALEAMRTEP